MAAILALDDAKVEDVCAQTTGVVVAVNYNCPGQLVISGEVEAVKAACTAMTEAGAKRALLLNVGGAFHSPLMSMHASDCPKPLKPQISREPRCPIYQNATATPHTTIDEIRANLIAQYAAPVRSTRSRDMVTDGAGTFTEVGPGKVLQGLVKKIRPGATSA